ncbi:excalibur calcium-binding domain-containing protein [Sphingomonas sp. S2-65]|uniref:excalibur calcium-binding domain-containing protein n=1 Tax=Sphingomonas sp. S2-65 TaxID=2903960 RepID=UPI001F2ADEEB|nr:excalibur calcium-binding domain-containing protein [Sphingomonas sp. S2-65]UYY57035.1 excalibur calcium-binding domain-containing protein [Sphingomonas sp. S2-65]
MVPSAIGFLALVATITTAPADTQRRKRTAPGASTARRTAIQSGEGAYFANCSQARAAGAAPVRRGDPGYSRKLDRDGDGIGCE